MDVSSINSDLIRGNVTTIILKALMTEDRYGYDILREIEVKSGGQYKLKQPTLYSCLKRLEKQGLISSYWGDEADTEGGRRRYYALTEAGRGFLNKMQSEYEYSRTILDSLLSEEKFNFDAQDAPFDINSLRPYTKRKEEGDEKSAEAPAREVVEVIKEVVKTEYIYLPPEQDIRRSIAKSETENPVEKAVAAPANADDEKVLPADKQPMFEPLRKEGSSFDNQYRHSSRSVMDIVGQIDEILSKKPDGEAEEITQDITEETAPLSESGKASENETLEQLSLESLIEKEETVAAVEYDVELEREKRENAKKLLGIGSYNEQKFDLDKFGDAQKKSEFITSDEEIPAEEVKKFDLFSPVPIDRQLHPEKYQNETEQIVEEEKPSSDAFLLFDKYKKKEEKHDEPQPEPKKIIMTKSPVPPASSFSFRKDEDSIVNYRDAFSALRKHGETVVDDEENTSRELRQKPASNIDLKTKLFSEGYKLRPYTRENTENYYSLNYIKKNRINRDCYGIMFILICLEVLAGWLIFRDRFPAVAYAAICIIALLVPAIPFVKWSVNPDKRVRASYNFRTSILNRLMLYLNCLVVVCLLGFFAFGADINNAASMVTPILIPAVLLLNIPLSSVIFLILFNTKKYHIS